MTKPELTIERANQPLVACLLAVILSVMGTTGSQRACAQADVRSGSDVVLNNGIPREVREVTIEQKLGGSIQLNLPMRDSRGERVESGYFIDGNKPGWWISKVVVVDMGRVDSGYTPMCNFVRM